MSRRPTVDPVRRWCVWAVVLSPLVLAGCKKATPPLAIVTTPDAAATEDAGSGFTIQMLGCGQAGTQSAVAVSGSTVGFVSLAQTSMTQTCTIMPMENPVMSQVELWNICYAQSNPDGTYTSKVVATQPYNDPTGVGVAFDSKGDPSVAYTGVGMMPSAERCGANDLFVTTSVAGTFGMPVQVSNGSMSDGLVAAQATNCTGEQNVCNQGDTTGLWPAIGYDPSDNPMVAYRDVHFGFAMDDFAKSDVEFAEGGNGSYSVLTVDVSRGGGTYNRVAFTPAGLPAVLTYDETGMNPGVYIDQQVVTGDLGAQEAMGGWTSAQVSTELIGNQLGFAISAQGVYGAAYYDMGVSRLLYTESMDGMTWSTPASVDLTGTTGFYPSLAFDSAGEPAIAYYRCSSHPGMGMNCDPSEDGLLLARRSGTTWAVQVVRADPSVTDGVYPALAFVNGKIVIAYQITSFDPASMTSSATWWVAEGQ
jgi:hypothetical protein